MVVTRKKLRSFKFTSIAQRWQDKAETGQRSSNLRKLTKTKQALISKKERSIAKKKHLKGIAKEALKSKREKSPIITKTTGETLKTNTKGSPIIKKIAREALKPKTKYSKKTIKVLKKNQKGDQGTIKETMQGNKTTIPEEKDDNNSTPSISKTMSHSKKPSMETLNFKCTECEFTTTNQSHFTKHIKRQILICSKCDFQTDLRCVLHAHSTICRVTKHKIKPDYDKNLKTIAQKGPVYFCDFCPYICKERFEIVEHVKKNHKLSSSTDMYLCSCCNFETKLRSDLRLHYIHVHQMLSENVKYIADRSFKNERVLRATDSKKDVQEVTILKEEVQSEDKSPTTQPTPNLKIDPMKKRIQEKKELYLKTHLKNTVFNKGSHINREGKENKKKQYIESQLQSLKEKDQQEIQKKLTEDCQSGSSDGSENSYSGQSDKSDSSEIAEIIKVFFQDKAIEISLKRSSSSQNASTAKRKCVAS